MTVFTLMTAQRTPVNAANGVYPTPVAVPGAPTRGSFTLTLSAPPTDYVEATVLASTPGVYNTPWEQRIYQPIAVMQLQSGQAATITQDLRFGAAYDSFAAQLQAIGPHQAGAASLTLTV